ncbi:MAG TPA: polysaccharide biosynthesis/export family protein [Gemmataceae bacterium]|nr:polysaccharide biosynthesis/export family protein [Gemmataceae bacterium]
MPRQDTFRSPAAPPARRAYALAVLAALLCGLSGGCAALTNPVAEAVPVHRLPEEVHGRRREEERTIPLPLLRQPPPPVYRLAPGDVLGVWVEGILGDKDQPPPVLAAGAPGERGSRPPAIGYPIPVMGNGSIRLPLVDPIPVAGKTLDEVEEAVLKAYTVTHKILLPGTGKVIVTLVTPRTYHVLVVRQDTGAVAVGGAGGGALIGQVKRGTGYALDLPAYENDVLNALTRTGGLPGLDAENEVVIQRGTFADFTDREALRRCLELAPPPGGPDAGGGKWVRIPLRLRPGEEPPFRPEDVILRDGDIVFIEARDTEVFYTAGLLGTRQIPLPRDYSLDVVEAVAFVSGPLVNGGINGNNLSGSLIQTGIGFPSPSLVTVLRKTPGGGQIAIRVDLNKALRDRRETVLVQPGDVLVLQQTPLEALSQYVTNQLHFSFLGTIIRQNDLTGTAALSVP